MKIVRNKQIPSPDYKAINQFELFAGGLRGNVLF